MENKVIQSIVNQYKEKTPNFNEMERDELIKYIKENLSSRIQAISFIRACLMAVQQSYLDAINSVDPQKPFVFEVVEGEVIYYPETKKFEFTPNSVMNNLFSNISIGKSSRLKNLLNARFYKILETAFEFERIEVIKKEKSQIKEKRK